MEKLRKCTYCKLLKGHKSFYKEKRTKLGLQARCRACKSKHEKVWWYKNHEARLTNKRIYRLNNRVELNRSARKRYWDNVKENRKRNRLYQREYYQGNKEKLRERSRLYGKSHRDLILIREQKWAKNNSAKYKAKNRRSSIRRKALIKVDGKARLSARISNLIRLRLKARLGSKNKKHRKDYLPYNIDELMVHLEKKFTVGMTWDNYGKWHIDHVIPDCSFNYLSTNDVEFKTCWALENLQPLWALDNRRKGGRLSPGPRLDKRVEGSIIGLLVDYKLR